MPNKELTAEIAALKRFNGNGCVKLIDSDSETGWMIIEKLEPGEMLSTVEDDEKATRIDIIAEMTDFDRERLLAWSFVKAMLTAWWCYEGKIDGIKIILPYAEILKDLTERK